MNRPGTINSSTALISLVLAGNITGTGALTLGGPSVFTLDGQATPALVVNAKQVHLDPTFNGSGPITVNTDASLFSAGIGVYTGTITLIGGTLYAAANNAFGRRGRRATSWCRRAAALCRVTAARSP